MYIRMELIERIPLEEINFLNEMDLKTFKLYTTNCKNEDERKIKFDIMKSFCQTNIKTRGETKRVYSYTQSTPLEVGGRLYCGNSIQGLPKDIRGLLLRNVSTDADMRNAHPVILKYLCTINKIPCPNLSWYIDHRDEVLTRFGEDGKTAFLKAVNDDKLNKKISDPFFKDFDKESKQIQKIITGLQCYKHIVDSVPPVRTYNWLGSAINRILCVFENKILQEVIHICNQQQIEICSLMFDGLMMYGNHYNNTDLLLAIETQVNSVFEGLNMKFAYKGHSNVIQIPADFQICDTIQTEESINSFEKVSTEFELTHCKINNKGFFIKETPEKLHIMSKSHLITAYENMTYQKIDKKGEIVECNFINDWIKNNPQQRCYDEIDCFPNVSECPDNIFNTWRSFAMELITEYTEMPDELEFMRNHIKILCGNDATVADYIEKWIAQMIQFPEIKSICPTFISKQGAGKGSFMGLIGAMLGESKYFETTTPSRDVWGDFNSRMADSFFINLDELSRKESMECEGKIKGLITNPRMTINEKGIKQYAIKSFHRFAGTTNNEDPLKTTKDDRRNLIINASNELIGNAVYFNKWNELMKDVNFIKTCYEYFKSIPDMENFNKIPLPQTEYQTDMKDASISPIEMWIKSFVLDNYYETEVELLGSKLFELFKSWCKQCGMDYNLTLPAFGLRLKRLNVNGIEKGKHTNKGETKIFNIAVLKDHFKLIDIVKDTSEDDENYADDDM
jgi:hypothetical protein